MYNYGLIYQSTRCTRAELLQVNLRFNLRFYFRYSLNFTAQDNESTNDSRGTSLLSQKTLLTFKRQNTDQFKIKVPILHDSTVLLVFDRFVNEMVALKYLGIHGRKQQCFGL